MDVADMKAGPKVERGVKKCLSHSTNFLYPSFKKHILVLIKYVTNSWHKQFCTEYGSRLVNCRDDGNCDASLLMQLTDRH